MVESSVSVHYWVLMLFETSIFAEASMGECLISDKRFLRRVITTHITKNCISGKGIFDPFLSLTPIRVKRSLVSGIVFSECLDCEHLSRKFDANWHDIQWWRGWVVVSFVVDTVAVSDVTSSVGKSISYIQQRTEHTVFTEYEIQNLSRVEISNVQIDCDSGIGPCVWDVRIRWMWICYIQIYSTY